MSIAINCDIIDGLNMKAGAAAVLWCFVFVCMI